jgi:hypothetical protein
MTRLAEQNGRSTDPQMIDLALLEAHSVPPLARPSMTRVAEPHAGPTSVLIDELGIEKIQKIGFVLPNRAQMLLFHPRSFEDWELAQS